MVNYEKLINLVFEKEPLWNTKSKCYYKRDVCRKLWNDISVEMGVKSRYASIFIYTIIHSNCNL